MAQFYPLTLSIPLRLWHQVLFSVLSRRFTRLLKFRSRLALGMSVGFALGVRLICVLQVAPLLTLACSPRVLIAFLLMLQKLVLINPQVIRTIWLISSLIRVFLAMPRTVASFVTA